MGSLSFPTRYIVYSKCDLLHLVCSSYTLIDPILLSGKSTQLKKGMAVSVKLFLVCIPTLITPNITGRKRIYKLQSNFNAKIIPLVDVLASNIQNPINNNECCSGNLAPLLSSCVVSNCQASSATYWYFEMKMIQLVRDLLERS